MSSKGKKVVQPRKGSTASTASTDDNTRYGGGGGLWAGGSPEFIHRRKGVADIRSTSTSTIASSSSSRARPIGSIMYLDSHTNTIADDYNDTHGDKQGQGSKSNVTNSTSGIALSPLKAALQQFDPSTSWETWWIHSPPWRRQLVFLLLIMAVIGLMQLLAAITFFAVPSTKELNPYLCTTDKCRQLSKWINSSSDFSNINPCSDFYKFSCNNHKISDTGDLFKRWFQNFARLESDGENGESILAKLLTKPSPSDVMAQRIVKFYQVCMDMWQTKTIELDKSLTMLIRHVFRDVDIWCHSSKDKEKCGKKALEKAAMNMVNLLGDYGFFKTLAPVGYPDILVETWTFTSKIQPEHVRSFLPIIFDALNITGKMNRYRISQNLYALGNKLDALNHGSHYHLKECDTQSPDADLNFDFKLPFNLVYHGLDNIDSTTDKWILKGRQLNIKLDPLGWDPNPGQERYDSFESDWNCWMQKKFKESKALKNKEYMIPSYATFWSLRLLVELVHDADSQTAEKWDLVNNPFFEVFTKLYNGRQKESRCYQSMLTAMGYYPIFAYFDSDENHHLTTFDNYQNMAVQVVKHAGNALLEQFRPIEEGGMPSVSSRYRERVYRILSTVDLNDINILVPILEDDPTFNETTTDLDVGDNHIQNIIVWREFTFRRTRNFWLKKSPQGKLVWYNDFYVVDQTVVYESPSAANVPIINVPSSIFVFPFWNNDMEVANYAGARVMVAKIWMKLLQFDYSDRNIEADIADKYILQKYYREGVTTDYYFPEKPCEVVTYNWIYPPEDINRERHHALTPFDPHFLSFRYGRKLYGERMHDSTVLKSLGAFQISIALRAMLTKYFEEVVGDLRERDFSEYSEEQWTRLMHQKLIGHETFSDAQLFFLLSFRQMCRSFTPEDVYFSHIAENVAALGQMREFAETWRCPPDSPMNPVNKCFSVRDK